MFLFGSELHQYIYIFFFGRTHLNVKVRVYLLVHYPVDLTFFFFLSHQHSCFVFGIIFIVEPCSCFPTGTTSFFFCSLADLGNRRQVKTIFL